jgi:hypothetical protein
MSYLLVARSHGVPSPDTLGADSSLGHIWAQVDGDDWARSLHVQEVWGERTLWRIGVVGALLLLLLGLTNRRLGRAGPTKLSESTEEWVIAESGERAVDVESGAVLP